MSSLSKSILDTSRRIYCVPVVLASAVENGHVNRSGDEHYIAVIGRDNEACVLLMSGQPGSMPPIVLKIIPVYADFRYAIAQAAASVRGGCPGFRVSLFAQQGSEAANDVLFPVKENMVTFLNTIKAMIDLARKNKLGPSGTSHHWIDVYTKYCLDNNGQPVTAPNTMTTFSAIPRVLPWQDQNAAAALENLRWRHTTLQQQAKSPKQMLTGDAARQHWLNSQLVARQDEFVTWDTAKIFVGTWNVHGRLPTVSLKPWLAAGNEDFDPDFIVIGLQEMENAKDAYVRYDTTRENAWVQAILKALGNKSNDYYKVATQQLVTILIVVIAKKKHQQFITNVDSAYVGVGLMNMMGNKGGVGIRLRFRDSYFCFIGCHLAAFTEQIDRRNQDFVEICKRLVFVHQSDPLTNYIMHSWNDGEDEGMALLEDQANSRDWTQGTSVFHSDHLIWLGDLNYRINISEPEVKSWLRRNRLDVLADADQLTIERRAGRAFSMFEEGRINFHPTYKYDAGTNFYDSSSKRRAPAWTDRVLWKSGRGYPSSSGEEGSPESALELLCYDSCMDLSLSDHKPVYAHIKAKVRKISSPKYEACKAILEQQISSHDEKTSIAQCQLSAPFVNFGDVQFMEYKEKSIVLENTGRVLTAFRFVPKLDEGEEYEQVCPSWLQIHPMTGVLGSGDKVEICLRVLVDPSVSAPLNEGNQQIDTVLVLRLENGKDLFVAVSGRYVPTCFGIHLERLALMTLPVTAMSPGVNSRKKSSLNVVESHTQQATLPKELWRVLNYLWNKSMLSIDTLFLQHGDRATCDYIRRCLDSGNALDTTILLNKSDPSSSGDERAANSMVDVLVAFLECLPEPVIPTALYGLALEAGESPQAMIELKDKLPYIHLNVLLYFVSFLKDAIQFAPDAVRHERTSHILQIFTILLRPPLGHKEQRPHLSRQKASRFILQLLH